MKHFKKLPVLIFIGTIFIFLFVPSAIAQEFQRTFGGTGNDLSYSIIRTTDGGYSAAGYTYSFGAGNTDLYIVKLDASGSLLWSKTIGGTGYDYAYSIVQTTDGGYAAAGYTYSFGAGNTDLYIVKLDASGSLLWSKTIGGTSDDFGYAIIQTTDGGYVLAGETFSFGAGMYDMYIVKLDASGSLQWSRTVGGMSYDAAYSIIRTTDGGYAVAGYSGSFGGFYDVYIVKLTSSGSLQWSKTVGGTNDDVARFIIQTAEGGYAVVAYTNSFGAGSYDMYIIKLDTSGSLQWSRTVGGAAEDRAYSIIQTTDGGYLAAGETSSFGVSNTDMYMVKLDAGGLLQWSKAIGGTNLDHTYSIIRAADGGYSAAGETNSFGGGNINMYIVKFNASGNICGNSTSPSSSTGTGGTINTQTSTLNSPGSTVTTPTPTTNSGGTLTTICFVGIQSISNEIPASYKLNQNHPNPFNPTTKIRFEIPLLRGVSEGRSVLLKVYDILGREVATLVNEELKPGIYEVEFDGSNFAGGIYFYQIITNDFRESKKMILTK